MQIKTIKIKNKRKRIRATWRVENVRYQLMDVYSRYLLDELYYLADLCGLLFYAPGYWYNQFFKREYKLSQMPNITSIIQELINNDWMIIYNKKTGEKAEKINKYTNLDYIVLLPYWYFEQPLRKYITEFPLPNEEILTKYFFWTQKVYQALPQKNNIPDNYKNILKIIKGG